MVAHYKIILTRIHVYLTFTGALLSLQISNTTTVDGIDYYVTTNYGEELYNSCKDVKFGTLNTRAMDFLGGGAKTYKGKT